MPVKHLALAPVYANQRNLESTCQHRLRTWWSGVRTLRARHMQ